MRMATEVGKGRASMARTSLLFAAEMRTKPHTARRPERRCSYVVLADRVTTSPNALRELAGYLSNLGLHEVDIVVLDPSAAPQFDATSRVLRWVGRHVSVKPEHRTPNGA